MKIIDQIGSGCKRILSGLGPSCLSLVLGLLVAFALRVYRLGDQNIWWDEGLAIWAVRHHFLETTLWTAGDVHPPLYFW
ncbi:MAG: hypothetical protein RML46_13050, partial [Anaerolineae bacterium]|nr:hypothetical protein [Anaerolineae bacterium]